MLSYYNPVGQIGVFGRPIQAHEPYVATKL